MYWLSAIATQINRQGRRLPALPQGMYLFSEVIMIQLAIQEPNVAPAFVAKEAAAKEAAHVTSKPPVKSRLKAVAPKAAEPSKPKMLIFGKPGVGKTWASLEFPKVYYIDTEGGADLGHYTDKLEKSGGVYLGVEQGSLDFSEVLDQIKALATEQHPYKTLVIDSISKLFNTAIAAEAERLSDEGKKNEFGADKKPAVSMIRQMISWLTRLDMNVILIAHEKPLWGLVKGERQEVGVTFDCWDKLEYELHLCLNIMKMGDKRMAKIRKSRLMGFPDNVNFEWSYTEFATRYGKDIMEKPPIAIQLATPEQLAETTRLLGIVKLSDTDRKDKWLAEHKDSLSEMETHVIIDIINHLKGKIQ